MSNVQQVITEVSSPATRSGMAMCKELFAEITAEGYQCAEGRSPRQEFIARAIAEAAMTKKGSETYWQSLKRAAAGGQLYVAAKKKDTSTNVIPNAGDVFRPGIQAAQAATQEQDDAPAALAELTEPATEEASN